MSNSDTDELNLGLSEILKDEESIPLPQPELDPVTLQPQEAPSPTESKLELIEAGVKNNEWARVSELADVPQIASQEDLICKSYWIEAQLNDRGLPASMLAGIFDELCERAANLGIVSKVGERIQNLARKLSTQLRSQDELEIAVNILERTKKLTGNLTVELAEMIDQALKEFPDTAQLSTAQMKRQLRLLSLKREIKEELPIEEEQIEEADYIEPAKLTPGVNRGTVALVGGLAMIALLFGIWRIYFSDPQQLDIAFSPDLDSFSMPLIAPPALEADRQLSQLAMVYYDIDKTPEPQKNAPVVERKVSDPEPGKQIVSQQTTKQEPARQEVLKMDGPYESKRIEDILDRPQRVRDDTQYDDDARERDYRDTDRERDRRDRIYDERRREERRFDERRRDVWEKGDRYEVLINTSVMERPSFQAKEVAELYSGDYVLVEARIGRWLRIRSVRGAPGFIMAQDAQRMAE